MTTKKNKSVKNQSANALQYVTYTSEKSGKTIPVVIGFTGKDDERLPYIAYIAVGEVKSENGKVKNGKDKKAKKFHGPAYATYSVLPLGKGGERIPCAIWGADPRWHDIAKLAAVTVNDLDALTQEAYDALCDKAEAVYQAKKVENQESRAKSQESKVESREERVNPKSQSNQKPKSNPKTQSAQKETSMEATKKGKKGSTAPAFTQAELEAAFKTWSQALHLSKENCATLSKFMNGLIKEAEKARKAA